MALNSTKYQDAEAGNKNNAGTSSSARLATAAELNADGVTIKVPNHGHTLVAGDGLNVYGQDADGDATLGIYEITGLDSDHFTITPSAGNSAKQLVSIAIGGEWPIGFPAHVSGTGNISQSFGLSERFTLVRVLCHFSGGTGVADFTISLDSVYGAAYDVELWRWPGAGSKGEDIHFRIGADERNAWMFEEGDLLKFAWTDPGTTAFGLLVSFVPTSHLEAA